MPTRPGSRKLRRRAARMRRNGRRSVCWAFGLATVTLLQTSSRPTVSRPQRVQGPPGRRRFRPHPPAVLCWLCDHGHEVDRRDRDRDRCGHPDDRCGSGCPDGLVDRGRERSDRRRARRPAGVPHRCERAHGKASTPAFATSRSLSARSTRDYSPSSASSCRHRRDRRSNPRFRPRGTNRSSRSPLRIAATAVSSCAIVTDSADVGASRRRAPYQLRYEVGPDGKVLALSEPHLRARLSILAWCLPVHGTLGGPPERRTDRIRLSNHCGRMENSLLSSVERVPEVAAGVAGAHRPPRLDNGPAVGGSDGVLGGRAS